MLSTTACSVIPVPQNHTALALKAEEDIHGLLGKQEPLRGGIDLYEAIARALKYNLDQRVEAMQEAVRLRELSLASYQGLPNLVAGSAYSGRNNYSASRSYNIITRSENFSYSTSSERENITSDLTLSWNVLDFGLSYIRAKQAADQVLIQQEMRRRALNRIVEDVRTAYWRAAASERFLSRLSKLEAEANRAIADSRQLGAERQTSPVAALSYEREVLEMRREAQKIEGELHTARAQLAALMNISPGTPYRLTPAGNDAPHISALMAPDKLVRIALINRPEMRETGYRSRILEQDANAALLEMLPGINLFAGENQDPSRYLYNNNWIGWGAKASWNLMKVFQYPAKKAVMDANTKAQDEKALAVTMAITTQVHVSHTRYLHAQRELKTAEQLRNVHRRILQNIAASAEVDRISGQVLVREKLSAVVSEVRYDLAHATLQSAHANIYASLGLDAFPVDTIDQMSVAALASTLRQIARNNQDLHAAAKAAQAASTP